MSPSVTMRSTLCTSSSMVAREPLVLTNLTIPPGVLRSDHATYPHRYFRQFRIRRTGRHDMSETPTPEIDVEELAASRESGVLVDVREPDEYVAGHVPGAVLIPTSRLANR